MVDREVAGHEARHAAMAVMLGLEVSAVDALGDGVTHQGQLRYHKSGDDQRMAEAKTLLAGGDIAPGFPPNGIERDNADLVHLRRIIDGMRLDASRYYRLKSETEELMSTLEFKALERRFTDALMSSGRLDEQDIDDIVSRWAWDKG